MTSGLKVLITELEAKKTDEKARLVKLEEILSEKPIIEYCPSFLNGLELDAFSKNIELY
ncbi:5657_t:CDS:2 [Funneliformis geosporum]|nr:5657_t:CDS:2 [Funneliformis geosporum]